MLQRGEYITSKNYNIHKDEMKSFDLLLFRGNDVISDAIANIQCNDKFTHVGLVIHPSLLPDYNLDDNKLYVLESTFSHKIVGMNNGPPDSLTGEDFFGVQLRDFEAVCNSYIINDKTKIMWMPLSSTPQVTNFSQIFSRYHQRPFLSNNILDFTQITPELILMAKSILTKTLLNTILQSSFSCVNLVTSIYNDLGIIHTDVAILYPCEILALMITSDI